MKTLLNTVKIPFDLELRIKEDCVVNDSGHTVYWPTESKGYFDEYHLVMIAAYLHKVNKDWDREIDKYFEEHKEDSIYTDADAAEFFKLS